MDTTKFIKGLREQVGLSRKDFSQHTGIPVRTLEDWEAGRRTPPEYIPRLISYQLELEKLQKEVVREESKKETNHSTGSERNVDIIKDVEGNRIAFVNDLRFKGQRSVDLELVKAISKEYGLEDEDLKIAVPVYDENELKCYEVV